MVQNTVAMKYMKGERGSFLLTKPKHDYDENYHHVIQDMKDGSTLNQRPEIKFSRQTDRDSTSYMKEAFGYMNDLQR